MSTRKRTTRRRRPCNHRGDELTAAYSLSGEGRWRAIVWCAKCGALGFRDHDAGGAVLEEWRRPTSRARRAR
jgi:hypothetical protein